MRAVVDGRDSVVVLPTGGGKTLCFQAPALAMPGLAVVVSPLISLMKDQVDALVDCGVRRPASTARSRSPRSAQIADEIRGRAAQAALPFARAAADRADARLSAAGAAVVHRHRRGPLHQRLGARLSARVPRCCGVLKERFPERRAARLHRHRHAACPRRHRPRAGPARRRRCSSARSTGRTSSIACGGGADLLRQIREVIDRHPDDSGIIYCIRRADVEEIAAAPRRSSATRPCPTTPACRTTTAGANQDAFINDRCRIIVATVAFGMGIDKSNVRYVIHAGRAEVAEVTSRKAAARAATGWKPSAGCFTRRATFRPGGGCNRSCRRRRSRSRCKLLAGIDGYRRRRHLPASGASSSTSAQSCAIENCGACDVCLAELDLVDDPLVLAQKILSCVVRVERAVSAATTWPRCSSARSEERILERGHDRLSTWGILAEHDKKSVRDWIDQLVDQGFLGKSTANTTCCNSRPPAGKCSAAKRRRSS